MNQNTKNETSGGQRNAFTLGPKGKAALNLRHRLDPHGIQVVRSGGARWR